MKRKKLIVILSAIVIIAFCVLFISKNVRKTQSPDPLDSGDESSIEQTDSQISIEEENGNSSETDTKIDDPLEHAKEDASSPEATENLVKFDLGWDESWLSPGNTESSAGESSHPVAEEPKEVSFPYAIPGTNLILQNITSYDGIYLEDGSDSDVGGVAVAVIINNGTTDIEYAEVTVKEDGRDLRFELSGLPAGKSIVAQEMNRATYQMAVYKQCIGKVADQGSFELSASSVSVTDNEDGSLSVRNLTGTEIPCVRIFYKFYLADEQTYVGGITYTAKIENLEADGTQIITPSHYTAGNSQVIMVRTYSSAE